MDFFEFSPQWIDYLDIDPLNFYPNILKPMIFFHCSINLQYLKIDKSIMFSSVIINQIVQTIMIVNSQQQLLTKILLLSLENTRLNQKYDCNTHTRQSQVLSRIQQIQTEMALDLRHKQQQLEELSIKNRQLSQKNIQLTHINSVTSRKLEMSERYSCEQVSQYQRTIKLLNQKIRVNEEQQIIAKSSKKVIVQLQNQLQHERKMCRHLKDKQSTYQEQLKILSQENKHYGKIIGEYREQLKQKEQDITNYKDKLCKLESQIGEKTKQLENIRKQCTTLSSEQKQNSTKISKYQQEILVYRQQSQKQKKQLQSLKSQLKQSKQELKEFKKQSEATVHTVNTRFNQYLQDFTTKENQLTEELQRKSNKLKEYDENYNLYVKKMNGLQSQLNQCKGENKFLNQLKTKNQAVIKEQVNKIEEGDRNRVKMEVQLEKLKSENEKISTANQTIKELKEQMQLLQKNSQPILRKSSQIKQQNIKLQQKIQSLQQETSNKQSIINSLSKEVENYRRFQLQQREAICHDQCNRHQYESPSETIIPLQLEPSKLTLQISKQEQTKIHHDIPLVEMPQENQHIYNNRQRYISQQKQNGPEIYTNQQRYNSRIKIKKNAMLNKFPNQDRQYLCCEQCSQQKSQDGRSSLKKYNSSLLPREPNVRSPQYFSDAKIRKYLNHSESERSIDHLKVLTSNTNHGINNLRYDSTESYRSKSLQRHDNVSINQKNQSINKGKESFHVSYEKSKDPKLDEIQKYLSFELKPTNKLLYKSNSDTKFENRVTPRITSQRQETLFQNGLINRQQQKALHSKINQINSWRQQPKIKNSGFYKKLQNSSRLNLRTGLKRTQKQNLNDIIQKKCMYAMQNR